MSDSSYTSPWWDDENSIPSILTTDWSNASTETTSDGWVGGVEPGFHDSFLHWSHSFNHWVQPRLHLLSTKEWPGLCAGGMHRHLIWSLLTSPLSGGSLVGSASSDDILGAIPEQVSNREKVMTWIHGNPRASEEYVINKPFVINVPQEEIYETELFMCCEDVEPEAVVYGIPVVTYDDYGAFARVHQSREIVNWFFGDLAIREEGDGDLIPLNNNIIQSQPFTVKVPSSYSREYNLKNRYYFKSIKSHQLINSKPVMPEEVNSLFIYGQEVPKFPRPFASCLCKAMPCYRDELLDSLRTDFDLLWHLKLEAAFLPRTHLTPSVLKYKAIKFLDKFDMSKYSKKDIYYMITSAVTGAMLFDSQEVKCFEAVNHDENLAVKGLNEFFQ